MRRIFAIVILLCISYFIGGYVAVHFGLITQDQYLTYAGIVGGLASVAGLFSFIKPALTKDDLQSLELESLKSLVETTEQVKGLEEKRLQAKSEIGDLEVRKKEMELLVKKASMSLFLKEQYSQHEHKILSHLKSDDSLKESLSQIADIKNKLDALEEEIEADPNVETLREVIKSANRKQDSLDEAIDAMPHFTRTLFIVLREFSRALTSTFGSLK
jgi:hypothetical protein